MNDTGDSTAIDWIEIVPGFTCNCRCRVCPSTSQPPGWMEPAEVERLLELARARGAGGVWFGGGEPTLYPHLAQLLARARLMGFTRLRLQSNGLRLAYPAFSRALQVAGLTEVSFALMGASAASHDHLTRRPGSFQLLQQGLANCRQLGLKLEADVLVTERSLPELARLIERFHSRGIDGFTFWWTSLHGLPATEEQVALMPSFSRGIDYLVDAFRKAEQLGVRVASLHTPPCLLPERYRAYYRPASSYRLLVATPGGTPFPAEDSPMEGGVRTAACRSCSQVDHCLGARRDYLERFGEEEFSSI